MLQEKIEILFQRNPGLHILFYFDETGEQRSNVENLNLPWLTVEFVEDNWLYIQHKYHHPKQGERVFIYLNRKSPEKGTYKDFPLLGLLRANRELFLDDVGMLMEDYQLQIHQKYLVKKYKTELGWAKTKDLFKAGNIMGGNFTESDVQHGLISTFLDFKKPESKELIVAKLLTYSLPSRLKELKTFQKKINDNQLSDVLKTYVYQFFDFAPVDFSQASLADLIHRIKYNSIVQGLGFHEKDPYQNLRIKNGDCMPALNSLREAGFKLKEFVEAFELHGTLIRETEIVNNFGVLANYAYIPEKLAWAMVGKMLPVLELETENVEKHIDNLMVHNYKENSLFFTLSFLKHITALYRLTSQVSSKKWDRPEEYLNRYTKELYQVDFHHRKALYNFKKIDFTTTKFDDELKKIKSKAEKSYNRFISELNGEWLDCLASIDFDFGKIEALKQYDFFEKVVSTRKQKTVVIISDALRYEIANELLDELHKDSKNASKLSFSLASIPSVTSVGMVNLLPGEKYAYHGAMGEIKVDGIRSSSMSERELILQKKNNNIKAISFDTLDKNDKETNRELFKSDIVYVYHDVIDMTGHKGDEKSVFLDTQRAINELARMVKLILGGMNVNRLIITSDHGFLYTDADIKEVDKNVIVECDATEKSSRHYVTSDNIDISSGYKIPLFKTSRFEEPYYVIIPYSTNRFKVAGSRYQFVHGGGSLQELVVPIIESTRKDETQFNKVNPLLLGRDFSVVSNVLKFQLLQDYPISAAVKERVIIIKLFAGNEEVSAMQEVVLNFVGEKPGERIKQIVIPLTVSTNEAVLKLKIFDISDELNPLIEENIKNSTLVGRDF